MKYIILLIISLTVSDSLDAREKPLNSSLSGSFPDDVKKYLNFDACHEKGVNDAITVEEFKTFVEKNINTEVNKKAILVSHLGALYFRKKNYDSAIVYIKMLPENLEGINDSHALFDTHCAFFYLAFSYYHSGETEQGKNVVGQQFTQLAGKKDFSNIQYFCNLCMTNSMYLPEALNWAKKSVDEYDRYLNEERIKLSRITDTIERQKAEENLKSSEENYYWVLNTYGELSARMNNYSDALNAWKKLLTLPDCLYTKVFKPLCKAYSAVIYIKSGDSETGERLIKEIQENSNDKTDALFFLPIACARYKVKVKEAISWAEEGLKLRDLNNNYSLYDAYAELLFEDGQIDKAIKWETEAYQIMPLYQLRDKIEKYKTALK
ncbi:MAG: hypothetical protein M1426_01970 [Patescibacteria group bacterium]|nr:hypothetical protein [Patescibacteria group bacterium]